MNPHYIELRNLNKLKGEKHKNDSKEKEMIKDKNLGQSFLKIGRIVHLGPSKNLRLNKEDLNAEYEVIGFWYDGKLVIKDPVSKQ